MTSGDAPLSVVFTDQSTGMLTGDPRSWLWKFGDGTETPLPAPSPPSHTYLMPGNYLVSLTVSNSRGSDTKTNPVYITVAPNPNDGDADGVLDSADNCALVFNPDQNNSDEDSHGDPCDNCVLIANEDQSDSDSDGVGDVCDVCPGFDDNADTDGDGKADGCDNCELYNPQQLDCQPNEVGDVCDLDAGASVDFNANTIPDECEMQTVSVALGPHDTRKHRYVSINASANESIEVGLRVDLVAMKRCSGDLERSCVEDNDCDLGATGPCVEHPDVGSAWWVQGPQEEPLGCLPGPCGPTDQFARVGAAPHFQIWDLTTLHIGDCEIVPVATYEIRVCAPPDGTTCADPVTVTTILQPFISPGFRGNYGDVAGNVVGTEFAPPDGVANVVDISAYQLTAQNYGTANTPQTHPTWVDLNGLGAGQPPQYILNVADLGQILKALQGAEWTTDPGNLNPGSCP